MKSVDTKAKKRNFELHKSTLFQEFEAERQEILKHKWLESEKAGHDIGFETALIDWVLNHREKWRNARKKVLKNKEK